MEPVIIPIDGTLDLHTFDPKELAPLLDDYLSACQAKGIFTVKIIHGKGKGILKARVRKILKKNNMVQKFEDATLDTGGWGATLVELKRALPASSAPNR